jgi:hypothetical protein
MIVLMDQLPASRKAMATRTQGNIRAATLRAVQADLAARPIKMALPGLTEVAGVADAVLLAMCDISI